MLRRLIPYSSALALMSVGCTNDATVKGDEAATSDTGGSDVAAQPDVEESDQRSPDGGASDVVSRDVGDGGASDVFDDAESRRLSGETIASLRSLCERFAECGLGSASRCRDDFRDLLVRGAYAEGVELERCDVALHDLFSCFEDELDECSWDSIDDRCLPETGEAFEACNPESAADATDATDAADAGGLDAASDLGPDSAEADDNDAYVMSPETVALIESYCEIEESCNEVAAEVGRCAEFVEQAIGIANDPAECEETTRSMLSCLIGVRTLGCDASTVECQDYYAEFDAACAFDEYGD